jgi:hypothetical protein
MNITPASPTSPASTPPAPPRLSKTTFITYVALLTILSISVPFFSIPLFAVTVLTLAATGRLKSTVNTVKSIAKETFGHKSELQVEEKQGLLTNFQTTIDTDDESELQTTIDNFHATLLRDFSDKSAPTVIVDNAELEANFKPIEKETPRGLMWNIFFKDANRGAVYEINGRPSAIRDPNSAFADMIAFCGGDIEKAQTLTLLIQQGELEPITKQFSTNGIRIVDKSGYFVKLKRVDDKIQIQLWVATSVGNFRDPLNANSTPKPIWGCVQLTVSEADLDTGTFESAKRKVFYLPRSEWPIDSVSDDSQKVEAEKALPLLNAQIAEQRLEL